MSEYTQIRRISGGGGGVTDHGALTGLADDDHSQYHNDARGDARYKDIAVKEENISNIAKGQVICITGAVGGYIEVGLADCNDIAKMRVLGLAQEDISQNTPGIGQANGTLVDVDTRPANTDINPNGETWAAGDMLYSATVIGGMTNVRPTSGRIIKIARTLTGSAVNDNLYILNIKENPVWATAAAGEDVIVRMGDSIGVNKASYRDYGNNEIGSIDSDGNLALSGVISETDAYKTKYVDVAEMIPCTTNGALQGTTEWPTNDVDIDQLAFDAGAILERAQFKLKLPENWDLGTLKVKFDWTGAIGCTAGDTVEWRIKARAIRDNDAIDVAMGTLQLIVDTLLVNNGTDWQTSGATPALIVGGTPAKGCTLLFELDRNGPGSDTMAEDALLYGLTIQYKKTGIVAAW